MTHRNINLLGWVLFTVSAVGFIVAAGAFLGDVWVRVVLVACLVFLIPFFTEDR